jgi:hypothetical protein
MYPISKKYVISMLQLAGLHIYSSSKEMTLVRPRTDDEVGKIEKLERDASARFII